MLLSIASRYEEDMKMVWRENKEVNLNCGDLFE
jgi:hypothetical protein